MHLIRAASHDNSVVHSNFLRASLIGVYEGQFNPTTTPSTYKSISWQYVCRTCIHAHAISEEHSSREVCLWAKYSSGVQYNNDKMYYVLYKHSGARSVPRLRYFLFGRIAYSTRIRARFDKIYLFAISRELTVIYVPQTRALARIRCLQIYCSFISPLITIFREELL